MNPNKKDRIKNSSQEVYSHKLSPIISYIFELRKRLIICTSSIVAFSSVAYFYSQIKLKFILDPLTKQTDKIIYINLPEAFLTHVKVAIFSGICLSVPIIITQAWLFISPGLYKRERKAFLMFAFLSPLLFLSGAMLAYYVVCPMAWNFFLQFQLNTNQLKIVCEPRMSDYVSLVTKLILSFGICFQLPLIIIILTKIRVLSIQKLKKSRKYVFLGIVIFSALFTPPDIISPISLIIPLYALYEISLLISKKMKSAS